MVEVRCVECGERIRMRRRTRLWNRLRGKRNICWSCSPNGQRFREEYAKRQAQRRRQEAEDRQRVADWLNAAPEYDPRFLAQETEHYQQSLAEDKAKDYRHRSMHFAEPPSISVINFAEAVKQLATIVWAEHTQNSCPPELAQNRSATQLLDFTHPPLRRLRGYADELTRSARNIGRTSSSMKTFLGSVYRDPAGDVVVLWRFSTFDSWRELG